MEIKKNAFTLAEVLITLAIIGVIAAMSVPTLLQNLDDQSNKTAYKKAFNIATQALRSANTEGTLYEFKGSYGSQGSCANFNVFKSKFHVIKECYSNNINACWESSGEKWRGNTPTNDSLAFIDNSGYAWALRAPDHRNILPVILVDTNGIKGPNKYGKDRFPLMFTNGTPFKANRKFLSKFIDDDIILGTPYQFLPMDDALSIEEQPTDGLICPNPPCYFNSWLSK